MQSQLKQGFPLTYRRPNTLYIRAQSQPTHRIKTNRKIKINLKRLPTDFFTGPPCTHKINNMPKLKLNQQPLNQCYRQSAAEYMSNTVNFSHKQHLRDLKTRQLSFFKRAKMETVSKEKDSSQEVSSENNNTLNWTFAKKFVEEERKIPDFKSKTIKVRTQRSKTIQTEPSLRRQQEYLPRSNKKWQEDSLQVIHHIISDKITEINLNRLQINVRRNNHPQSTLNFIRKQFG